MLAGFFDNLRLFFEFFNNPKKTGSLSGKTREVALSIQTRVKILSVGQF
jgi:hypothetical protein